MATQKPTLLSETALGEAWVRNFEPADRELAIRVLNKVRSVTYGELRSGLISIVAQELEPTTESTCLFPVREPRRSIPPDDGFSYPLLVPEPDTDRPLDGNEGSEAVIANILRDIRIDLQRDRRRTWSYLTQDQMRDRRVRRIVLVDDYSATGRKAATCLEAWRANPTVRSWISYKWLTVDYFAYAIARDASSIIEESIRFARGTVHSVEIGRDFSSSLWMPGERIATETLCRKYARKKSNALGWDSSAGLMLFAHKTPNNLPAIFTQVRGPNGAPWTPIATRRGDAMRHSDINDVSYKPLVPLSRVAVEIGQTRLANSADLTYDDFRARLLIALGAIVRHKASPEYIADVLRTSKRNATEILKQLQAMNLIDATTQKLTDAGWDELRYAKGRARRSRPIDSSDSASVYYPQSLRRGGGV